MEGQGFEAEIWFSLRMESLRMVEQPPSIKEIKRVLMRHLPNRVERALNHMRNVEDPSEWLDLAFKTDVLLRVENMQGEYLRIAVDVTADPAKVESKFKTISSRSFAAARKELGINYHWVVLVDVNALPTRDELMDAIYEQVDVGSDLAIIKV